VTRSCESCGDPYEAVRANARFCSERCKKRAQRGHVADVPAAPGSGTSGGTAALVSATRRDLQQAGRLDTFLGQAALSLAARIEADQDTGSAIASLNKELRATVAEALKGVQAPASSVTKLKDELAARRQRRA
jgi:hypothetical protein